MPTPASSQVEPLQTSILLVEDAPADLLTLEAILEPLGQRLIRALSGEEALTCCLQEDFAVILMDVGLPGIDGLEAARRLSALRRPPVVVLVSTHDEEEFGDTARSCGAVAYIKKSVFGPDRLAAAWALASSGSTAGTSTDPSGPLTSSS